MGWDQAETGMEGDSGELFAATKGAVMAFTRSLALSLAPTVRVNALAPGLDQDGLGRDGLVRWQERVLRETPLARWGTPEDVARVAAFLVGPGLGLPHRPDLPRQRRGRPLMSVQKESRRACHRARTHGPSSPRILFVTGRLAEFALRQVLEDLAPRAGSAPRWPSCRSRWPR